MNENGERFVSIPGRRFVALMSELNFLRRLMEKKKGVGMEKEVHIRQCDIGLLEKTIDQKTTKDLHCHICPECGKECKKLIDDLCSECWQYYWESKSYRFI